MRKIPTILVVEDDVIVRNLMVQVLVPEDYRVLEADSATEALAVSQEFEGTLELLIADHTLKTMTGREVAEKIRESRPALKILHVSGYPLEKLKEEGEVIADAGFLGKPFLPRTLLEKVREILAEPEAQKPDG